VVFISEMWSYLLNRSHPSFKVVPVPRLVGEYIELGHHTEDLGDCNYSASTVLRQLVNVELQVLQMGLTAVMPLSSIQFVILSMADVNS
jgi:hypothetical protein